MLIDKLPDHITCAICSSMVDRLFLKLHTNKTILYVMEAL